MATPRKIFIDESVFYAFVDRSDANHQEAVKALEQFSLTGMHIFTSIQVIQDAYNAISKQLGTTLGHEFLQIILESDIEVIYPQKSDLISTYKLIKLNATKQISFKEAMTAVLMQKKGIVRILTFRYWQNLLGSVAYIPRIY